VDKRDEVVTIFSVIDLPTLKSTPTPAPAKKVAVGAIVGGLVGGAAAGLLLAAFVIWYMRHRKKKREEAKAAYERRQRRLAAQRRAKGRQSMASVASSGSRLNIPPPSEKGYDPSVPFPAPRRPTPSYSAPKQHDRFANEKGYGYEPQPLTYVPAGGDYYVQQPFEQPSVQPSANPPAYASEDQHPRHSYSSVASAASSRRSSRRSSDRASKSDQAALAASRPVSLRHRPSRPSPLAWSSEQMPNMDFSNPQPGPSPNGSPNGSPTISNSSSPGSSSPPATSYVHEPQPPPGAGWGIALGDPEADGQAHAYSALTANSSHSRHSSSSHRSSRQSRQSRQQHRHHKSMSSGMDPFAEYSIYENGLLADENNAYRQHLPPGEEDAPTIDFSSPPATRTTFEF